MAWREKQAACASACMHAMHTDAQPCSYHRVSQPILRYAVECLTHLLPLGRLRLQPLHAAAELRLLRRGSLHLALQPGIVIAAVGVGGNETRE